jgi:site-specific recombinase XerD
MSALIKSRRAEGHAANNSGWGGSWVQLSLSTATCRDTAGGYKLANDGQDARAIQHYLGHRSIASTVRDTALAPDRFKGFWKD